MKKTVDSLIEAIGCTPMLRLSRFCRKRELSGNILAKLEAFNPASSIKDRAALYMIEDAEKRGLLKAGGAIVEPTSGNTGIGLAWIAAVKGYKLILTMPETMSVERRKLAAQFGAEIVLTEGALGMSGAIAKAKEIAEKTGAFMPMQFENDANCEAHRQTTAPEIIEQTGGEIAYFISAVGTGGTLTGVGEILKNSIKNVKIIAVEPVKSPVLSGGRPAPHGIQGIGAGFIPKTLNASIIDEIITVSDEDALETSRALAREEGVLAGISSGAALYAAAQIAARSEAAGTNVVVILPDTGERYLSTVLF